MNTANLFFDHRQPFAVRTVNENTGPRLARHCDGQLDRKPPAFILAASQNVANVTALLQRRREGSFAAHPK